jgi:hypothetical protein
MKQQRKKHKMKDSQGHNKTNSFFRDGSVGRMKVGGGHGMTGFDYKPDYVKGRYSSKAARPESEANAFRKVKLRPLENKLKVKDC